MLVHLAYVETLISTWRVGCAKLTTVGEDPSSGMQMVPSVLSEDEALHERSDTVSNSRNDRSESGVDTNSTNDRDDRSDSDSAQENPCIADVAADEGLDDDWVIACTA